MSNPNERTPPYNQSGAPPNVRVEHRKRRDDDSCPKLF